MDSTPTIVKEDIDQQFENVYARILLYPLLTCTSSKVEQYWKADPDIDVTFGKLTTFILIQLSNAHLCIVFTLDIIEVDTDDSEEQHIKARSPKTEIFGMYISSNL